MKSIIQLLVCCSLVICIWGKPSTIFFQSAHSVVGFDFFVPNHSIGMAHTRKNWFTASTFFCCESPGAGQNQKVNAPIKTHEKADRIREKLAGVPLWWSRSIASRLCLFPLFWSWSPGRPLGRISRVPPPLRSRLLPAIPFMSERRETLKKSVGSGRKIAAESALIWLGIDRWEPQSEPSCVRVCLPLRQQGARPEIRFHPRTFIWWSNWFPFLLLTCTDDPDSPLSTHCNQNNLIHLIIGLISSDIY